MNYPPSGMFIMHHAEPYYDYYLLQKAKLREKHPVPLCPKCPCTETVAKKTADGYTVYVCAECGAAAKFSDGHVHLMARRKAAKLFLSHLWEMWRRFEGLEVRAPYIHAIGGHTNFIPPPLVGAYFPEILAGAHAAR